MPKAKRFKNSQKLAQAPSSAPPHDPLLSASPQATPHLSSSTENENETPVSPQSTTHTATESASDQSQSHVGRESKQFWTVQTIDSHQNNKIMKLKVRDVFHLPLGVQIVVRFDDQYAPYGEEQGILAGFCGNLAADSSMFPINFKTWRHMPMSYLDHCWGNVVKPRFCFEINESMARRYVMQSIGKKWAANRLRIWDEFYDLTKSRNELIKNVPDGIGRDQWASYVDHRLHPETQALCTKNAERRKKQIVTHTGGSKSIARRRHEMSLEYGHPVGRGHVFLETHKHRDGSWVNDTAKEYGEKIEQEMRRDPTVNSFISPNDAVAKILGKEHPGRVRSMGLTVTPTSAFGNTSLRLRGLCGSSSNSQSNNAQNEDRFDQLESQMKNTLNAFMTYVLIKEGRIPDELASIFDSHPQSHDDRSQHESHTSPIRRSSSASNQDQ